jgi:hypothetical protein
MNVGMLVSSDDELRNLANARASRHAHASSSSLSILSLLSRFGRGVTHRGIETA